MASTKEITITGFPNGIADSPHLGFADMRNIDTHSESGVAKISQEMKEWTFNGGSGTFTADAGTDILSTTPGDIFAHDVLATASLQPVVLTTTGTLPAGLSLATTYYVIPVTNSTLKLATTIANAEASTAVDMTDAGSGTHTITSVDPGDVKHIAVDPATGHPYALDSNGRVWKNKGSRWTLVTGNTRTNGTGNGLVIWKSHLIAFRSDNIDIVPLSSTDGGAGWTNGWQKPATTTSGTVHKAIVGEDDIVYWTDGPYVGSLEELTTFAPGTPATFSFNSQALDLPQDFKAIDLEELGDPADSRRVQGLRAVEDIPLEPHRRLLRGADSRPRQPVPQHAGTRQPPLRLGRVLRVRLGDQHVINDAGPPHSALADRQRVR